MANKLYEETTFVESAEVTATQLNAFDDRISDGFDIIASALVSIVSDNSVIDDPDVTTELEVTATSPASMNVNVNVGVACVGGTVCQNEASALMRISTPTTNNRYTIIQISNIGVLSTKNSTEAGSPVEPTADTNNIKLAAIYLPQSTTIIEDTDNGNGYIIDRRPFSTTLPQTSIYSKTIFIPGSLLTTSGANADGYVFGSTTDGDRFNFACKAKYCSIQLMEATIGADTIITIHNVTDATSDTVAITDGAFLSMNNSIDIDFDSIDKLAIQITQEGSTQAAGWANIIIGVQSQ